MNLNGWHSPGGKVSKTWLMSTAPSSLPCPTRTQLTNSAACFLSTQCSSYHEATRLDNEIKTDLWFLPRNLIPLWKPLTGTTSKEYQFIPCKKPKTLTMFISSNNIAFWGSRRGLAKKMFGDTNFGGRMKFFSLLPEEEEEIRKNPISNQPLVLTFEHAHFKSNDTNSPSCQGLGCVYFIMTLSTMTHTEKWVVRVLPSPHKFFVFVFFLLTWHPVKLSCMAGYKRSS